MRPRTYGVYTGDCREHLAVCPDNGYDAVVTDPPYNLTITKRFGSKTAKAATGPAQYQRLTKGFMNLEWDGSGIAFDSTFWKEVLRVLKPGAHCVAFGSPRTYHKMVAAMEIAGFEIRQGFLWLYGSGFPKGFDVGKFLVKKGYPEAPAWDGFNTAIKPGWEPIVDACKPLDGTMVNNVREWMVGPYDVGTAEEETGRYPSNVILGCACEGSVHHIDCPVGNLGPRANYFYCAKPSREEKEAGLDGLPDRILQRVNPGGLEHEPRFAPIIVKNIHPTVKPVSLLKWLMMLVVPSGGARIFDPFCGSGSSGVAAIELGNGWTGCEGVNEYAEIALARLHYWWEEKYASEVHSEVP
jgi:site-specific DNA-methyltransferase (adenine-specific)